MCDAIRRFLFDGARPIDRTVLVIDFLVLLVIVIEWIRSERRERALDRKAKQREKAIGLRLTEMFEVMTQGQALQHSVPGIFDVQRLTVWRTSFADWMRQAEELLRTYSPHAEAAFKTDSRDGITYPGGAPAEQSILASRLRNLRGIMEKPDVYF